MTVMAAAATHRTTFPSLLFVVIIGLVLIVLFSRRSRR
jgi:hypothetical protein